MDMLKDKIKAEALRLGFSFIGFTKPQQTPHFSSFEYWLNEAIPEELHYLKKSYVINSRKEPEILLEDARSVIVLGIDYPKNTSPFNGSNSEGKFFGQIAAYACLPDYHRWFKDRSRELISFMKALDYSSGMMKFFVDSGPVMEKDFAFQAGLGWIGKNSLFISPIFGSFCLLGCLFVDLDIEADLIDETDRCGKCDICVQACPTQAISNKRTIIANRCISFLTTNAKGYIPDQLCRKIGNHIYGCDICQSVCPLNKEKLFEQNNLLEPIINAQVDILGELFIDESSYFEKYSLTPMVKLPREIYLRNLIIAAGNSGDKSLIYPLKKMIKIQSSSLLHRTANWAILSLE